MSAHNELSCGPARYSVARCGAQVRQGIAPHRVTEYFAGPQDGSLRADMEAFASGQEMSDRLRLEVSAYQLCKLDDTWTEASHSLVSSHTKKSPAATIPFCAASLRLSQTLASFDEGTEDQQQDLLRCYTRWRSIAHPKAGSVARLVPPRNVSHRQVVERCTA